MKKITLLFLFSLCFHWGVSHAESRCDSIKETYEEVKVQAEKALNIWRAMDSSNPNKAAQSNSVSQLLAEGVKIEKEYNNCLEDIVSENKLKNFYFGLGNDEFSKEEWDNAIQKYIKVVQIDPDSYQANYNIASAYANKGSYDDALDYYKKSLATATTSHQLTEAKEAIKETKERMKLTKASGKSFSNDTFSSSQYYLETLNVPEAWKQVDNPKKVTVAIIDDGVNINHPDLTRNIWIDPSSKYWSSKIIDFVGDHLPDNFPTGEHGTMIAGIIGATSNNNIGIAGIAKNVDFMPLRVFDVQWDAREYDIIQAIYYAIEHGANIINLSLGQTQFQYSERFDDVIRKAYENGIAVVIAAGNGDVLAYSQSWVNTTVNPVSPICNNAGNVKYSLGVGSLDKSGKQAPWTNYGLCVGLWTPGEDIFSTSVAVYNVQTGVDYATSSGTSFSAPMISGIIALGFNKYWFISPDLIHESLMESRVKNSAGNYVIDTDKYLEILGIKIAKKSYQNTVPVAVSDNYETENNTTISQWEDDVSDVDFLVNKWLVVKRDSLDLYRLNDPILRQEILGLAMKIRNFQSPAWYVCRNIFRDVLYNKPNTWACPIVEYAADTGVISKENSYFRPEEYITNSEALAIIMKAAAVPISQYQSSNLTIPAWQVNVIGTAYNHGFIGTTDYDYPNQRATRWSVFAIVRKILESQS